MCPTQPNTSKPILFLTYHCGTHPTPIPYQIYTNFPSQNLGPHNLLPLSPFYFPPPNHSCPSPTGLIGLKKPSSKPPSVGLPAPALPLGALGPLSTLSRGLCLLCNSGLPDSFLAGAILPTTRVAATGSESVYRVRVSSHGPVMGEVV